MRLGASLTLGDPSSADTEVLDGVTLDNAGSTTLAGSPGLSLKRRLGRQPADREFHVPVHASIFGDGTTAFTNAGALTVPSGVTAAFIQPVFAQTSTGSTMVQGGHVYLQGGGTISGSITVAMGTILELDGPPAYEFGSASSISGTGTVAVAGRR